MHFCVILVKTLVLFGFHLNNKPFHFNDVCFPLQLHLLWSSNAVLSPIHGTTYAIGDHLLLEMMKVSSMSPMLRNFTSIGIKYFFSYQWYSGWSPWKIGIAFFRCGSAARVSKNLVGLIECLPINLLTIIWAFNTKHILLQRILILEMIAGLTSKFLSCPESRCQGIDLESGWPNSLPGSYLFQGITCLLFNFLFLHSLFISVTFKFKKISRPGVEAIYVLTLVNTLFFSRKQAIRIISFAYVISER